ncbi:MAG: IS1 family transposase [Myxococcota bacterium]
MGRVTTQQKAAAIGAITEGVSLRATSRLTGLSRARLDKLVLEMGRASERLLDEHVRGFRCEQIEADELWTYIGKRRHRVREGDPADVGDAWIWSAIDPDSKLIPAHHVGKRQLADARAFGRRLRRRIEGRPQFNTDRLAAYRTAILGQFSTRRADGTWDRPDWGTVVKHFETGTTDQGRYVPPRMAKAERRIESGNPDPDRISTSHIESQHLQFRMRNKRAARMTNAASKTHQHLRASVAMYFAHYNFVRKHSTVRTAPAVAAGLADRPWSMAEFVEWGELYGR